MSVVRRWGRIAVLAAGLLALALESALAAPQLGDPAPELDIRLLNGKLVKASDVRGKVVLTMIWATWSPAARMQLPDIQNLYAARRGRGLEVLALSIDERESEVREFWRKRGYTMAVGMRSDAFFDRFGRVSTTPTYYVVDRAGVLRHRISGTIAPEKLAALLEPLLAEPAPSERFAHHGASRQGTR